MNGRRMGSGTLGEAEEGRQNGVSSTTASPRSYNPESRGIMAKLGSPGLPAGAAFILGALATLCVVFLTGGTLGVRWQGVSGIRTGPMERKFGLQEVGQDGNATVPAVEAAAAALECPDPVVCPKPKECPEVKQPEPCPACPAPVPTAAPVRCPKPEPCSLPPSKQPDTPDDTKQQEKQRDGQQQPDKPPQQQGKQQQQQAGGKPRLRMPWEPLLSASEARRGVGYYGSGKRLEAVVGKLMRGEPISAYTIGGSVTKGSGSSEDGLAYPGRFFEFINKTFPHKDHVLVNKGVGATSSGVFAACIEHMLPDGADLVVLEFTMNEHPDEAFTEPQRQGYEQLLRKLLRLPGKPALLQLHHYSWWRAAESGLDGGLFYFPMAEAHLYVMSQYYDIPSVSLRSATWHLMRNGIERFEIDKVTARHKQHIGPSGYKIPACDAKSKWRYFYYDRTHPNDQGHQVLAELLAGLMLQAAEQVAANGNDTDAPAETGWREERGQPELLRLPQPMIPNNEDAPSTLCAMQEEFKDIVVDHSEGFQYTAERPEEKSFVGQKWGWTATEPGAWAELEFDSRPDANAKEGVGNYAGVHLTCLRSYEGMGTARIKCVSGCKCQQVDMDGTWKQEATLMQNNKFMVSPSSRCRLRVTVLKEPGEVPQNGHKVKLMGIMSSHFPLRLDQKDDQTEVLASQVEVPKD